MLGTLFGIIFNTFFIPDEIESNDQYIADMNKYLVAEAIIVIIFSIPAILLFKSKPKYAPSVSQNNMVVPDFKSSIQMLVKNRNFMCLFCAFSIIVGYFNLMGTILNQFLAAYSITTTQTSIVGGVGNFLGILGCIFSSILIDKEKNYKKVFLILLSVGLGSQVILTIAAEFISVSYSFFLWLICWSLLLLAAVPCYAIGMDYVCEITYPIGEIVSGGFIMAGSQLVGIGQTYLSNYFLDVLNMRYLINVMIFCFFVFAFFALIALEEELLRNQEETHVPIVNSSFETEEVFEQEQSLESHENNKSSAIDTQSQQAI